MANIGHAEAQVENFHSGKIAHILINVCQSESVKSTLCTRPTAIFIYVVKHKFLYNNSCKSVCKLLFVFQNC